MSSLLLSYAGSKATVARWHAELFPRTQRYVSVFAGTGAEFLYRPATGVEVMNDLDRDIHNVFSVVRNPKQCAELTRLLLCTPDGRQQFADCKKSLDNPDPVRRAWAFLVVGNTGDIRCSVRRRTWFNGKHRLYWLPERLSWWCDRLLSVKLECRPWKDVVDRHDGENTLLYLDPPYHPDTLNVNENLYRYVMSAEEHAELLVRLKRCRSRVLLCGYSHPTYDDLLADWVQLQMTTKCRMGNRGPRTEMVWLNYNPPNGERIHA